MKTERIASGSGHGGCYWHDLRDSQSGAIRRIFLWIPRGPVPDNGWPALFMTDGNAIIATAIDAMRAQSPYTGGTNLTPGVLIGIGYPTDDAFDLLRRSWDLVPPPGATYPPFWPGTPEVRTGGAEELSDFIARDLRPFLEEHVRLNPSRQGLFGHSFGGLFTLWQMFTQPHTFTHWVAASPAIQWEDAILLTHRDRFRPDASRMTVHLSAGEWESTDLAPFQRNAPDAARRLAAKATERTLESARDMALHLNGLPGIEATFEVYTGETHMSALPVAVNRALHCVFSASCRS